MMPGYTSFHETYLSRLLKERENQKGAFFKTASEAVTAAFRTAAMETHRLGIIRCGYVGWHDSQIGHSIRWHEPLHSPLRNVTKHKDSIRGIGPDEPVVNWIDMKVETLKEIISHNQSKIGCFIIDAYLASFTDLETLKEVINVCHDNDMLVIFDETKTGGRISKLGYAHDNNLDADLIVIGKSLGNGAPLSILIGKENLMQYPEKGRLSGTFSKELFAVYSALATLDIMEQGSASFETGLDEIGHIGKKSADVICAASDEAGLREHLWAQPVLGGGMFELRYSDYILSQRELRECLLRCLTENDILMLEGHPSFVCLAHREIKWDEFQSNFKLGLTQWQNTEEFHVK